MYWLARTALWFAVFIATWAVGWRHWSAVVGSAVIAWLISYMMFGTLHDAAARQLEAFLSRRIPSGRRDAVDEDAEVAARS